MHKPAPAKAPSHDDRLYDCADPNRNIMALVLTLFITAIILVLSILLIVVFGKKVNDLEYIIFLTDKTHLNTAMSLLTAFIVIVFVSLFLESCLWCSRHISVCLFKFVIICRILFILVSIGLFAAFLINMNKYADPVALETSLKDSLKNYKGDLITDPYSSAWNEIHLQYQTCGLSGPQDWIDTPWYAYKKGGQITPVTCCRGIEKHYDVKRGRYGELEPKVYTMYVANYTHNFTENCFAPKNASAFETEIYPGGSFDPVQDDIKDKVARHSGILALLVMVCILQLFLLLVTSCVFCAYRNEKEEREEIQRLLGKHQEQQQPQR